MKLSGCTDSVSTFCKKLIQHVSKGEGLEEWKVNFWDIKGENECIFDHNIIYLDWDVNEDVLVYFFIHEVAHAISANKLKHTEEWEANLYFLGAKYDVNICQGKDGFPLGI